MRFLSGEVVNVKKTATRQVTTLSVEVPIEFHKAATAIFDDGPVLVVPLAFVERHGIFEDDKLEILKGMSELSPKKDPVFPEPDQNPKVNKSPQKQKTHGFTGLPLVQQAGIACKDPSFQEFVHQFHENYPISEEATKEIIYHICEVNSRKDLKPDTRAGNAWERLWSAFYIVHHGVVTPKNYVATVKELGCCAIVDHGDENVRSIRPCGGPANSHHIKDMSGTGRKSRWYEQIPLCHPHHQGGGQGVAYHDGPVEWERLYGTQHSYVLKVHQSVIEDFRVSGGTLDVAKDQNFRA